jgi:acetoin utilization deacetylase AcuC-like enzyme
VLAADVFKPLVRAEAPAASLETVALCHPMDYVMAVQDASPQDGLVQIDADTIMSPGSFEAALRGAGGAVHAVDQVMTGKANNAFVAVRPPGHHAETARPMGFCLFNNAAIAARYAQRKHGAGRAAIVDFDVHHGNGSQEIFWSDASVLYSSTHQMPLYPGTGAVSETGEHDTIVNAPLRAGDGGSQFKAAFETRILPRLREFKPDLVVISAGFDAHTRDPLANLNLVEADFAWATLEIMEIADQSAQGRVVSVLEGGYDLQGLAGSVAAHVTALIRG